MHDEFLHQLRKQPPPEFARQLKLRLRAQEQVRDGSSRFRIIRNVLLAFAIVGSAYAGAFYAIRGVSPLHHFAELQVRAAPIGQGTNSAATAADRIGMRGEQTEHGSANQPRLQSPSKEPMADHSTRAVGETGTAVSSSTAAPAGDSGSMRSVAAAGRPKSRNYLSVATTQRTLSLATGVVRRLPRTPRDSEPRIETVDEAAPFHSFCKDMSIEQSDIVAASRKITATERQTCAAAHGDNLIELKFAHRAVVIASTAGVGAIKLSSRDVFLALAKRIPDPDDPSRWIENPHRNWYDVNQDREPQYIQAFMTGGGDALRQDFRELIMEAGCDSFQEMKSLKESDLARYQTLCHTVREDGVFAETSGGTLISQSLGSNPNAIAIVSHVFFVQNAAELQSNVLDGVDPSIENIASEKYAASRALYLYVNRASVSVTPLALEFVRDFLSNFITPPDAPVRDIGLIPLSEDDRHALRKNAAKLGRRER